MDGLHLRAQMQTGEMNRAQLKLSSICNDRLELILLPTEQCNFRCVYCYETFQNKKMKPPVIAGVKALIDRRAADLDALQISWFGGEPLLALDVIDQISDHAKAVARHRGFDFRASITSNAFFLTEEVFERCIDNRIVSYHISLDGDEDLHNRTRVLGSGGPTFHKIWENLRAAARTRHDYSVALRLHYTANNYERVAAFAKQVKAEFGGDPRFQPYFADINQQGGKNDDKIVNLSWADKQRISSYLYEESGIARESKRAQSYMCYAAMANSLLVRSTGRLGKCTVALESDYNDLGRLTETGEIEIDQPKFQRWISSVIEDRWADAVCPLASVASEVEAQARPAVQDQAPVVQQRSRPRHTLIESAGSRASISPAG